MAVVVVPEGDLVLGALGAVGAVDDVAANVNAKVAPDGASLGISGVGGTNDLAAVDDGVPALEDHGDDGAGREVVHQAGEERLLREISVVLLGELLGGLDDLRGASK